MVKKVPGVSLGPTVDLGRSDCNFKLISIQNGDGTVPVDATGS